MAAGYTSQQKLADAITSRAPQLGLRGVTVGVRQVRRWESPNPPWPQPDIGRILGHLLGQGLEELGFTPPWGPGEERPDPLRRSRVVGSGAAVGMGAAPIRVTATRQPATVGRDFSDVTRSHRRLYWSVAPTTLLPAVVGHAHLGCALLPDTTDTTRRVLAAALAESLLLAGRIEFFDLQQPEQAAETLLRALQAAGEADDALLGSAILAHTAFIPGWAGQRDEANERMVAARAYARRGTPSADFLAWLDAVEAECETRCGNPRAALHLIAHGEDIISAKPGLPSPPWFDWFDGTRLAAFKGNTQLKAGHLPQARETLLSVLDDLPVESDKQRTVVLGDLAAVEAAARRPAEACTYAIRALEQLHATWYATGMERVREVRRALVPWQHEPCVRELDDRLYGWGTTVSVLRR
ncbi:transcriptional regulator [Streptomyces rectiverticillatus]|uniref:transcriptional regulator n=1 Tax=Streptomyces rectiverticillatus TaxID=173860 RepID=UPI001FEC231B|nr:transcriptional regulator [Streptomyces rectiverticillatus]